MSGGSDTLRRREFVTVCACAIAGGLLGGCASVAARRVAVQNGRTVLAFSDYPELARVNGVATILPAGTDQPLHVLRIGDAEYVALSSRCTHKGCTVEVSGGRIVCPCHGSTYDREGRVLRGPAERPLARYRLHVSESAIEIDLGGGPV